MSAQIAFNMRNFKFQIMSDVTISVEPLGCSLLLAQSKLHRPAGSLSTRPMPARTRPAYTLS